MERFSRTGDIGLQIRVEAQSASQEAKIAQTPEAMYDFFISRVKENLHIAELSDYYGTRCTFARSVHRIAHVRIRCSACHTLATTSETIVVAWLMQIADASWSKFKAMRRCEWIPGMYPSLVSCTTAIWLLPWPAEALTEVALKFLTEGLFTWAKCPLSTLHLYLFHSFPFHYINGKVCSGFMFACILVLLICRYYSVDFGGCFIEVPVVILQLIAPTSCASCPWYQVNWKSLYAHQLQRFSVLHTQRWCGSPHASTRCTTVARRVVSCHMTTI